MGQTPECTLSAEAGGGPSQNESSSSSKRTIHYEQYALLAPLFFAGFMDAVSIMIVPPSLFFYVLERGGSYESYGIVASAFSLSTFSFKLIFGIWSDSSTSRPGGRGGSQFRTPYLTSFGLAAIGGCVYFLASCTSTPGTLSIALIFMGRFLAGCGTAHLTLGYTYLARVIDKSLLTQASTILFIVRLIGMVLSVALNAMLSWVDTTIYIWSYTIEITPLNSVGFVLLGVNLLAFVVLALYLQDPQDAQSVATGTSQVSSNGSNSEKYDGEAGEVVHDRRFDYSKIRKSIFCIEILVPILTCFTLFCGFQLVETAMAPVVKDALGWGPVGASALYSGMIALTLPGFILSFELSRRGVKDEVLVSCGLLIALVGYTLMYLLWKHGTTVLLFCLPLVALLSFPLVQGPTYSIFSAVIGSKPALKHHQGIMQAILIMADSVAGFVAPGLISAFVLRKPQDVAASSDGRELTPLALYAPILNAITLFGVWYVPYAKRRSSRLTSEIVVTGEMVKMDETVGLLQTAKRKR